MSWPSFPLRIGKTGLAIKRAARVALSGTGLSAQVQAVLLLFLDVTLFRLISGIVAVPAACGGAGSAAYAAWLVSRVKAKSIRWQ